MAERTHNEIYDRLGQIGAELRALRDLLDRETTTSRTERKEIVRRLDALELINAERVGAETARSQWSVWTFRLLKWTFPYIPLGSIAAFVVWATGHWPT